MTKPTPQPSSASERVIALLKEKLEDSASGYDAAIYAADADAEPDLEPSYYYRPEIYRELARKLDALAPAIRAAVDEQRGEGDEDLAAVFDDGVNAIRWMLNVSKDKPATHVETFFDKGGTSADGTAQGAFVSTRTTLERLWEHREAIRTALSEQPANQERS